MPGEIQYGRGYTHTHNVYILTSWLLHTRFSAAGEDYRPAREGGIVLVQLAPHQHPARRWPEQCSCLECDSVYGPQKTNTTTPSPMGHVVNMGEGEYAEELILE